MKLTLILVASASFLVTLRFPFGLLFPFAATIVFSAYGFAKSLSRSLDPLNDVPNAFRVFLSSIGGVLIATPGGFLNPSVALMLLLGGLLLNDEYQRRTIDSIRRGRHGGTVAFLGIDGSGKSSHAAATKDWLKDRGYYCQLMPFHRYLFVERLSSSRKRVEEGSRSNRKGNPLRAFVSLLDNLLLHVLTAFGAGVEGKVVLYDRFIWSTHVKYKALRYPVRPLAFLYLLPRPKTAIVFDIPVGRSLKVIDIRAQHTRYAPEILDSERNSYLQIAEERGYPILDSTRDFGAVQNEIESYLSAFFPTIEAGVSS
jgi:dTMP kinase